MDFVLTIPSDDEGEDNVFDDGQEEAARGKKTAVSKPAAKIKQSPEGDDAVSFGFDFDDDSGPTTDWSAQLSTKAWKAPGTDSSLSGKIARYLESKKRPRDDADNEDTSGDDDDEESGDENEDNWKLNRSQAAAAEAEEAEGDEESEDGDEGAQEDSEEDAEDDAESSSITLSPTAGDQDDEADRQEPEDLVVGKSVKPGKVSKKMAKLYSEMFNIELPVDGKIPSTSSASALSTSTSASSSSSSSTATADQEEEEPAGTTSGIFEPNAAITDFSALKLSRPLLRAIAELGFTQPTTVQAKAIPAALRGQDVLVNAVTGSGKTAAFMLPILERLQNRPRRVALTRVVILTPTRELASQIHAMAKALGRYTDVRIALIVGGLQLKAQEQALKTRPDILVATPGRLIDHLRNTQSVHFEDLEILVLDEADRLLELGFSDEVKELVKACPKGRQTMLFSATLTEEIQDLVNLSLHNPKRIVINPYMSIVDTLTQEFVRIRKGREADREAIALALCKRTYKHKTIVFARTKRDAHRFAVILGLAGCKATELHGNLSQNQRLDALEEFREAKVDYLVCTDLAARGLDIQGVDSVINLNLPNSMRQYVHRVGRTARAGRTGSAVSLVDDGQRKLLKEILKVVHKGVRSRIVPPEVITKYRNIIDAMQNDITNLLASEREDKIFRTAEREAQRAQNLMTYRDEIMSRPARTWFQTEAEKLAGKQMSEKVNPTKEELEQAKAKAEGMQKKLEKLEKDKKKKDPLKGLSRAKKRRKLLEMEAEKVAAERKREAEAAGIKYISPAAQMRHAAKLAKAAKQKKSSDEGPALSKKKKKQIKGGLDDGEGGKSRKSKKINSARYADGRAADGDSKRWSSHDGTKDTSKKKSSHKKGQQQKHRLSSHKKRR